MNLFHINMLIKPQTITKPNLRITHSFRNQQDNLIYLHTSVLHDQTERPSTKFIGWANVVIGLHSQKASLANSGHKLQHSQHGQ